MNQIATNPTAKATQAIFAATLLAFLCGCSVARTTSGPERKDMSVLDHGTARGHVITELGAPVHTEQEDGKRVDYFKFEQGNHVAGKAAKGVLYGVAAVATLGVSEVITNPVEGATNSAEVQVKVTYDENDVVTQSEILEDKRLFKGDGPTVAADEQ